MPTFEESIGNRRDMIQDSKATPILLKLGAVIVCRAIFDRQASTMALTKSPDGRRHQTRGGLRRLTSARQQSQPITYSSTVDLTLTAHRERLAHVSASNLVRDGGCSERMTRLSKCLRMSRVLPEGQKETSTTVPSWERDGQV